MSLINEALKRAQSQQSAPPLASPPAPELPPQPMPKAKSRRRGFFWGFFAALLLVSIVSALSITVLTKVLLSDSTGGTTQAADNMNALVETVREATGTDATAAGDAAVPVPIAEKPVAAPEAPENAQPESPMEAASKQVTPVRDATVDFRALHALEIRGIMSGGSRVLIYDPTTNRSRPYSAGQALESLPDWTIAQIQSASILLRHHDGTEINKSF